MPKKEWMPTILYLPRIAHPGSVISRPVAIAGGFNPKSAHAEDWEGTAHAYVYSGSDYVAQGGMLSPSGSCIGIVAASRMTTQVLHKFPVVNQTGDILIGFSRTSGLLLI